MNIQNINLLIDTISTKTHTTESKISNPNLEFFNMAGFSFKSKEKAECLTPSCIAGWAAYLKNPEEEFDEKNVTEKAADFLGIDAETANLLFYPSLVPSDFDGNNDEQFVVKKYGEEETHYYLDFDWQKITPLEAVMTLIGLRTTGKVSWSHVPFEKLDIYDEADSISLIVKKKLFDRKDD